MFIDFAGMMTNIDYIINIYKVENYSPNNKISYDIIMKYDDVQSSKIIKEHYKNIYDRNNRFNELNKLLNAK